MEKKKFLSQYEGRIVVNEGQGRMIYQKNFVLRIEIVHFCPYLTGGCVCFVYSKVFFRKLRHVIVRHPNRAFMRKTERQTQQRKTTPDTKRHAERIVFK